MRQILDLLKTTVVGGAAFLSPFAAILLIVLKAGKMTVDAATLFTEKLPISKGEAVLAVYIGAALLFVLIAFAAGLYVRSFPAERNAASLLEDNVLNKLPPYVVIRKYTDRLAGLEAEVKEDRKPVLVDMQTGWQLGSLSDTFSNGHVAVFLPGAPDPSAGVIQIFDAAQVTPLDISYQAALACIERSRRGLPVLLAGSSFDKQNLWADVEAKS
jgi:uncharacterized membrane protein